VLIYFFTIIFLPILTLGIIGPALYSRTVADLSTEYTTDMVERVTQNLDLLILSKEKVLSQCLQDSSLQRFFFTGENSRPRQSDIATLFSAVQIAHPEITGIVAVTSEDRSIASSLERISRDPLTDESWYTLAKKAAKEFGLLTRPIGRNLRSTSSIGPDEVITLVKAVYHPENSDFAGVLMADLNQDYLEASFEDTTREDKVFFCIIDDQGDFVYAPINEVAYRIDPSWFIDGGGKVEKRIFGRDYRIVFNDSEYTDWTTVGVYYLEETMQAVNFVRLSALFIALLTFALTVIVSMVYSSAISKPVISLLDLMKRAGEGDLSVRYHSNTRDEIDELGRGLNSMLDQIQNLIKMVYEEQRSKREAELRILQQQIKPHFLYNTLDTIQWMAQEQRAYNIIEVVGALTRLFRVTLSQGNEMISLEQEIEHVHSYLVIQKIRYEDKFEYRIDCPDELKNLFVLKMILQPLVENSLYHGIKEKRGAGFLRLEVHVEEESLVMRVFDDGVGIPPSTLKVIRSGLEQADHSRDRSAFALYNVNDRIRLTYGDEFGITIDSSHAEGTVVVIRHPIVREEL